MVPISKQLFSTLVALTVAPACMAAPFCVQTLEVPPRCLYQDPADCAREARQLGGWCTTNAEAVHVPSGPGKYCVVTSSRVVSCLYMDSATCEDEARHQQGACVEAADRPGAPPVDPYRQIRPSLWGGQ
jgi:hypothetical protein